MATLPRPSPHAGFQPFQQATLGCCIVRFCTMGGAFLPVWCCLQISKCAACSPEPESQRCLCSPLYNVCKQRGTCSYHSPSGSAAALEQRQYKSSGSHAQKLHSCIPVVCHLAYARPSCTCSWGIGQESPRVVKCPCHVSVMLADLGVLADQAFRGRPHLWP